MNIDFSPEESKRHNLRIYRNISENIENDLIEDIVKEKADLIIIRVSAERNIQTIAKLNEMGLPYHYADTLLQYTVNLKEYIPRAIENSNLAFVQCRKEHVQDLKDLIYEIFKSYSYNHYTSNIYIKPNNVIDGYIDWILSFVGSDNKIVWLVKDNSNYVAFASCTFEKEKSIGVLYGVAPHAAGKHIYADLIRYTQLISKKQKMNLMQVGTQAQNYAVQRTWAKEGFALKESLITFHVNSYLSSSIFETTLPLNSIKRTKIDEQINIIRSYLNISKNEQIGSNIRVVELVKGKNKKLYSVTLKINFIHPNGRTLASILFHDSSGNLLKVIYHDIFFTS